MSRKGGSWDDEQRKRLWSLAQEGKSDAEIARLMGRTRAAITIQLHILRKCHEHAAQPNTRRSNQVESASKPVTTTKAKEFRRNDFAETANTSDSDLDSDYNPYGDHRKHHGKKWTPNDLQRLKRLLKQNKSDEDIGDALDRSAYAIKSKVCALGGKSKLLSLGKGIRNNSKRTRHEIEQNTNEGAEEPLRPRKRQRVDKNQRQQDIKRILLAEWGLEQYYEHLVNVNGFDRIEDWKEMTEPDLEVIGFKLGHKRRFTRKVAEYFTQ